MKQELHHPCKDTCSGWKQGYETGKEMSENNLILAALMAQVSQLLELTKCNSLSEVGELVLELRKK
jgi:hypothetical protein